MQLQDIFIACHAMQAIYILRDKGKLGDMLFDLDQSIVTGIGSHTFDSFPPPCVPVPDQFGVAGKGFWGSQIFGFILCP